MEKDFCQSLIEKDKETMKVVVDKYLSTLTLHEDQQQNFEKIKIWIENYDCVESVEIGYGVLDTEPPIKVFIIKLKNSLMQPTIGILLQKNKWIFNYK